MSAPGGGEGRLPPGAPGWYFGPGTGGPGRCLGRGGCPVAAARGVSARPPGGGMGVTRVPGARRSAGMSAMAASAAAACSGWGLDTSRARIAAFTVTFIPGMTASQPLLRRSALC
jgi:hypothetical protein